jgi:antitoxin component YwqK of YwqJK toxin-antitoxin module
MRVDEEDIEFSESGFAYYQGAPFTGELVMRGSEDEVLALTSYDSGVEEGLARTWDPDGSLLSEGEFRNGQPVGTWRHWRTNGRLSGERVYDDRGNILRRREWDEDNNMTIDKSYS